MENIDKGSDMERNVEEVSGRVKFGGVEDGTERTDKVDRGGLMDRSLHAFGRGAD